MRIIATVVAILLLAGCGHSEPAAESSTPATLKVSGSITVTADSLSSEQAMGGACVTDDGYSDITDGAQVTVEDSTGKAIALGTLQAGHVSELFGPGTAVEGMAYRCVFGFTVNDVPAEEKIYSVEVSHRGKVNFTREKLNGPIALTLG